MFFTLTTCTWYSISTLLVVYVYFSSVSASNTTTCPTWFYYNNVTCECGPQLGGAIHCNQQEMTAEIANGFCAISTKHEGLYYAGYCPFRHTENNTDRLYSEMPSDPDLLNDTMCGPYNRKGLLCGRCIDGYGPAVYSFDRKCANCSKISTGSAISLYLFLELISITLFFMCVVIFHLDITAGPLLGYVLFCQLCYTFPLEKLAYVYEYILSRVSVPLRIVIYLSLTLSGISALQFFKLVIPPFCISTKLTGIHIQILNLLTAIYPVLLVIITYILMELHARNYRIIHILWKPFSFLTNKLKITSVTSDAVIHAFATFILLSASTLSYTMVTISLHIPVYRTPDSKIYKKVLFCDPTITAFSHDHILYGTLAVVPFILLVLIPSLLLCVYPTRIYGYLSRFISGRKRLAITAFAEALNNCFKDGLNGTRDYRSLAGCITCVAIVGGAVMTIIAKTMAIQSTVTFTLTLLFLSLFISYVRPCKLTIANLSLSYHFMVLGIFHIAVYFWKHNPSIKTETLEKLFIIIPATSHILVFMWAGYRLTHQIMSHFGYQFNPRDCKAALTDLVNAVKRQFNRRRGSYQVLPDTTTQ